MSPARPSDRHAVVPNRFRPLVVLAALVALGAGAGRARASFPTLAERLPAASNAVVAVNVEKVLNSPMATQEQWRQNIRDSWANEPVMIPEGAARVLMASSVKTSTMEPYWEMSLIEMDKVPSAEELAKAEGGHVDKIWDKMGAYSPINAYFIPLDNKILASITPAERSEIAKWIRQPLKPGGSVTSPYIREVIAALGDKTDIVMAIDLEGAWGVPTIRRFIANNDIKEIPPKEGDQVAAVLGTMKGLTLEVRVDKDVTGRAVVQFGGDASALRSAAKPITLAVLNAAGMRLDDLRDWQFIAQGKEVRAEGKLTRPALRQLLSLVQSPIPAASAAAKPAPGGAGQPSSDPAVASQRYFKAITTMLDNVKASTTAANQAVWLRNSAKRIDQLPILNVDPALVEWGTMVSTKLKQAAATMGVAQTQINARVTGVMDPEFTDAYWDNNGYYVSDYNSGVVANARRQRQQVALEQRGQAQTQALSIVEAIAETRSKIRAEMVAKYKVEF